MVIPKPHDCNQHLSVAYYSHSIDRNVAGIKIDVSWVSYFVNLHGLGVLALTLLNLQLYYRADVKSAVRRVSSRRGRCCPKCSFLASRALVSRPATAIVPMLF